MYSRVTVLLPCVKGVTGLSVRAYPSRMDVGRIAKELQYELNEGQIDQVVVEASVNAEDEVKKALYHGICQSLTKIGG